MSMKDRLDTGLAESWRPSNAGDELIGKVVDFGRRTTEWGTYRIVTVQPEQGPPLAFHAFHTVARDQLASAAPAIGDEIGIRYLGRKEGGDRGYENYRIIVEHPAGWSPPSDEGSDGQLDREAQEAREAAAGAQAAQEHDESIPF